ncbi:UvrD-helicase domain-containing protein [Cellulosimicrobium sp. CUA-896]|uniref:UvrD-helicase domain-containing protein n=1 Tax=Cellulosimicrobium sp. CUA-896 TaxID=1517881 RepID=UPI00095D7923|nr:hypothetical protein BJF88_16830 [Cellulosimicrobium sp. CUA-896]
MLRTTPPRLVPRDAAHETRVELDESQRAAVEAAALPGATLVVGAPGTGKTLVAHEVVLEALAGGADPGRVLLLAATRRTAAAARDRLSAHARRTVGAPMVRTAASTAFSVLRERAVALGEPPPTLISGPEQDLVLAELLEGHLAGEGAPLALPDGLPAEVLGLRGCARSCATCSCGPRSAASPLSSSRRSGAGTSGPSGCWAHSCTGSTST